MTSLIDLETCVARQPRPGLKYAIKRLTAFDLLIQLSVHSSLEAAGSHMCVRAK